VPASAAINKQVLSDHQDLADNQERTRLAVFNDCVERALNNQAARSSSDSLRDRGSIGTAVGLITRGIGGAAGHPVIKVGGLLIAGLSSLATIEGHDRSEEAYLDELAACKAQY
jgi:hypothetical protein